MLSSYIKIAFRNLRKNRIYTAVNLLGLSVGISSCLLIGIYILHERSYDRFHKNADQIARITMEYKVSDVVNGTAVTGTKAGPQLARTFPEIKQFVRTMKYPSVVSYQAKRFEEKKFLYADSGFFHVFSFPLLQGNSQTALNAPDKVVITRSAAKKYFGSAEPLGKTLSIGENKIFIVSAVAADCPQNSQIQFEFVAAFTALNASKEETWWNANYYTYLLLNEAGIIPSVEKKVKTYMEQVTRELDMGSGNHLTYYLEPLKQVHLHSKLDGLEPGNNIVYIIILGIVAFLILVIACVNYTNLAIAQSTARAGEVGVRKVLGAQKGQLFRQFILESFFMALLSLTVAFVLAVVLLPYFNDLAGKNFTPGIFFQRNVLLLLLLTIVLVSILSGSYPALLLSNVRLIKVLKSGFSFTSGAGTLRKSLIVFQFSISLFLIIITIIILQQLNFVQSKDLGYDKDLVVVLPVDNSMLKNIDAIKRAINSVPGVSKVGGAYEDPTQVDWGDGIMKGDGEGEEPISVNAMPVDEDFIQTLGMQVIAGSTYTNADVLQFDTSDNGKNFRHSFVLNETAVKQLGWTPEEAIGKTISKGNAGTIKGVLRDFHFKSLHNPIGPLVMFLSKNQIRNLFVKVEPSEINNTLAQLEQTWRSRIPHRPFEYHFLDEDYQALYAAEQRTAKVFTTFSSLAILLACLGLFALTAYAVVQRTKEIGIRKVLGANLLNLFALLSKDFLILILIALLIACPVAWIAAGKWLEEFTYRISVQWWVFILAGVSTLAIAVLTLSFQVIKAGMMNPVKSLRSE